MEKIETKQKNYKRSVVIFLCFGLLVFIARNGSKSVAENPQWLILIMQSIGNLIVIFFTSAIFGGIVALFTKSKQNFYKYAYWFMWLPALILFAV